METEAQKKSRKSEHVPMDKQNIKSQGCLLHLPNLPPGNPHQETVPCGKDLVSSTHFSKTFLELRLACSVWQCKV